MRLSIQRLRWVLITGALLLVAVLAGYIGFGRYRAWKTYTNLINKAGVHISHDTSGFTYSQTEQGKTVFTLHAARATQVSDGQWDLHDVAVTLYGRMQGRADHIYGSEFSYDEKDGVVQALGEVHMDLQAPQVLTSAGRIPNSTGTPASAARPGTTPDAESADIIHVRTSGLRYLRKLGVAATDQPVEFHYGGVECTALGAEFDSSQSTVRLLANVVADGVMHGRPVHITATRADVDRTANIATLPHIIAVSDGGRASADLAVLNLRKDGSIQSAKGTGHVLLTRATQQITAAELDSTLSPQTVPQTAKLSGGVTLDDSNPLRPLHGAASVVDIIFDGQGAPTSLTATGSPSLAMLDKRATPRGLSRQLQGDRIVAVFVSTPKNGKRTVSRISELHAQGSAQARGESVAASSRPLPIQTPGLQIKTTALAADDLRVTFTTDATGNAQPHLLFANGHTLLQQDAPLGEQETSSGDKLDGVFAQSPLPQRPAAVGSSASGQSKGREELMLASAVQTGHVVVHRMAPLAAARPGSRSASGPQQEIGSAGGDRATYDGTTQKLTLSGSAHLTQDNASLSAVSVVLDQRTQDADALGNVQATLQNEPSQPVGAASARPAQFTHVLSSSAHFTHETRQAEFRGTDAQPARLWQEASQVQAATLLLDDVRHTFSARPAAPGVLIHAVFAGAPSTPSAQHPERSASGSVVRVASPKMDYSDSLREAVFTGGVEIDANSGNIHAQRAVAYLQPAAKSSAGNVRAESANPSPFNGSLDHVVVIGDVQMDQPGRHGTGDQLLYTAATGISLLTGSPARPPHIVDAQQGSITGATLLFGDSGSTIVVTGGRDPAAPADKKDAAKPGRVHTETHLQTGKEERQ